MGVAPLRLAAACAALCLVGSALVSAAARWREVRTTNFHLLGDARAGDMTRIAAKFEQFHSAMAALTSREAIAAPVPTVVLVFAGQASFRPYMPRREGRRVDVAGIFWGGHPLNYVGINAEYGEQGYPIVFHELTHVLTANLRRTLPLWLVEGLAEYHSSFEVRGPAEILLGRPIARHSRILQQQFIPVAEFLAVDHQSPMYNEGPRRSVFYAQSWALVHLLRNGDDTRGRLGRFVRAYEGGADQQDAFREVFGLEMPEVERRLLRYVRQFSVRGELWKLPDPIADANFTAADVPESVALAHLGRLLVRANRFDDAEARLRQALTAAPTSPTAHAAMAELRLRQDRGPEAWPHLEAASSAAADFFDHYLAAAAVAGFLEAAGENDPKVEAATSLMRERAEAAAAARPEVAEAWYLLATARLRGVDRDGAGAAIERAVSLVPGHERYRLLLADALSRRGESARARAILGELMARGQSDAIRTTARQLMATVVRREQYANAVGPPPADRPGAEELIPLFREVEPGETRISGRLTTIECRTGGVSLVVRTEERDLRITTSGFDAIEFLTYRSDLTGEVACGPRAAADPVLVTWRGAMPLSGDVQTARVVVEFTPKRP